MEIAEETNSLVVDAAAGSSTAFAELVRLHQATIRHFLARFSRDGDVVDDLAQEVFLTAFRKLGDFKQESTFSTWLHGIARNKGLHFLRTERRRKEREKKSFEAAVLEWKSSVLAQETSEDHQRFLEFLNDCLSQLAPTGRQVIDEYYFQRKTADEVGLGLNKGGGAIRMMLVRIRRALLKCLNRKQNLTEPGC